MKPILQVTDLGVDYLTRKGDLAAVRNANFSVHAGQIVALVGESGCGKSTLASAVMQLLPPNGRIVSGNLLLNGRDLRGLDDEEMRRLRGKEISMIFQDPLTSLNPVFTVGQQMVDAILSHQLAGESGGRKEARERAVEMLSRVGIPDPGQRIDDYPHQFSGGMRQRIMIALALQSNPSLLIADEPTSALDVTLEAQIIDLIRALRDERQTGILYITHNLGVVAQLCDHLLVLYAGSIVESGEVERIFKNPLHPYTRALMRSHPSRHAQASRLKTIPGRIPDLIELSPGCKFAERCEFSRKICLQKEPEECEVDGQRVFCHLYGPDCPGEPLTPPQEDIGRREGGVSLSADGAKKETILRLEQLKTYFYDSKGLFSRLLGGGQEGAVRAVDRVDLEVRRGETLALVGESGSGKTTLGRTILRLVGPSHGSINFQGKPINAFTQSQIRPMRARMQMIFQDPFSSLSPRKKVSQLLLEPFMIHRIEVDGDKKVNELLEMVGLSAEQADKYPHQLSGGQARRVGIARALALEPDLLIADEPTAGLDVSVAAGVLNLLKDLREKLNLTYVIITHNLDIIAFIADRIAVMYLGRIVEIGEADTLLTGPGHPYTKALMSAVALPDPELRHQKQRITLEGEIPSPRDPPLGCSFHPRCRHRRKICTTVSPVLEKRAANNGFHLIACHFPLGNDF